MSTQWKLFTLVHNIEKIANCAAAWRPSTDRGREVAALAKQTELLVGPQNWRSQRAVEKIGAIRAGSRPDASGRDSFLYRPPCQHSRRLLGLECRLTRRSRTTRKEARLISIA